MHGCAVRFTDVALAPACLPAYPPAYPPACLPACLPAYVRVTPIRLTFYLGLSNWFWFVSILSGIVDVDSRSDTVCKYAGPLNQVFGLTSIFWTCCIALHMALIIAKVRHALALVVGLAAAVFCDSRVAVWCGTGHATEPSVGVGLPRVCVGDTRGACHHLAGDTAPLHTRLPAHG